MAILPKYAHIDLPSKYLVFIAGSQICATSLVSIREVMDVPQIKKIPNVTSAFAGFCNWRGQVLYVLDLSLRLGFDGEPRRRPVLAVFDLGSYVVGAIIDQILAIELLRSEQIVRDIFLSEIRSEYVQGIVVRGEKVMTILRVSAVFSSKDLLVSENSEMIIAGT